MTYPSGAGSRNSPKAIEILLPVWGYQFVQKFLDVSLPTLLAPGNIPALGKALPCHFTLMTSADDMDVIREHPNYGRLSTICRTKIIAIDHLITEENYSTTLTLAYAEAVGAAGRAMLDTCFFFLVSDYIMADGSLANALRRVMNGASAVQVGNFHAAEEDFSLWLRRRLRASPAVLALAPRELVREAMEHAHPNTLARIVNFPVSHDPHANRLFWRVDQNTLIGRFYLMHMLCIRPETTDFVVGSSCDYSFIPEMCPSGNVETVTDSDEYFVVEMQPRARDVAHLRAGPLKAKTLAKSLSEWTTARHRDNARTSVVFHSAEIPARTVEIIAEADAFIAEVGRLFKRKAQPHRDHPYWRGAIAALKEAKGRQLTSHEKALALGTPAIEASPASFVRRLGFALFGRPPYVRPWHPRWLDYRTTNRELKATLADANKKVLLISDRPTAYTTTLADDGERLARLRTTPFLKRPLSSYTSKLGRFDACLIELGEAEIDELDSLLRRAAALMAPGGKIILSIDNRHEFRTAAAFGAALRPRLALLHRTGFAGAAFCFVHAGWLRYAAWRSLAQIGNLAVSRPWLGIPTAMVCGGLFAFLSFLSNLVSMSGTESPEGILSSVAIVLTVDNEHSSPIMTPPDKKPAAPSQRPEPISASMREAQYNDCLAVKEEIGQTELGLMTNQVWHDDPRRLAILLARYKFVAKMFSGRNVVAEVGCGDAFGTRIVQQEVGKVTAYDFDPVFIDDIARRSNSRWRIDARVHDALAGPLPQRYEGVYSLDVIEHIRPEDEDIFLRNLRDSLTDPGALIIGTPSQESQAYASPQSKAGHINCKTGSELKTLLERFFENVFVFSMNDEIVHTGFFPMAHYLLAICCGKK